MEKSNIFKAVAAAITLTAGTAFAADASKTEAPKTEDCKVVDKTGKNIVKAGKGDCGGAGHSCSGQNKAGAADAYIRVPVGQCVKINAGDFSGISEELKVKIDMPTASAAKPAEKQKDKAVDAKDQNKANSSNNAEAAK